MKLTTNNKMLLVGALAAWASAAPAMTVLDFDEGITADTRAPMPSSFAGLTWSGWHIEAYDAFFGMANAAAFDIPASPDGGANVYYLGNLNGPAGDVEETVTVLGGKPFFLESLDLFSYVDGGMPVDAPSFFSSPDSITIVGKDDKGQQVNPTAVVPLLPSGLVPPPFVGVNMADFGWTQPVHSVSLTPSGGAAPRFVMDNFAFTVVPLPPALLLLGAALAGLGPFLREGRAST